MVELAIPSRMTWWARQSTGMKIGVVAGGVAGVSLIAWGIHWLTKPTPVRDISEGCNDFAFANKEEVDEAILPLIKSARSGTGLVDPFYVTTLFLKKYAPECRSYPEEARNVGEALLYVQAFTKVVENMNGQRMISADQMSYFFEMVSVWGKSQGLAESQLPKVVVTGPPQGQSSSGPATAHLQVV